MKVRRLVHRMGYRYRLHAADLPGQPDLVFRARRKAIFVHGCFWHRHEGCRRATTPKTRPGFWRRKLDRQRQARTAGNEAALRAGGWGVLVIWECETKCEVRGRLAEKLRTFLA